MHPSNLFQFGSRTAFGSEIDARPRSRGESSLAGHLLLLAAVLALSAAYVYLYLFCQTLGGDQWNALAAMGQAIGAWATSVSFVVLIASLLSQRRQLRLQQEAVEVQFQELRNQGSSLEQTASAIAAQLFLQVLESAERTLARDMRTILQLCGTPAKEELAGLDRQAAESNDYSLFADFFVRSAPAREFLRTQVGFNPVLHDAAARYCATFDALRSLADAARLPVSLFEIAMDNAAHFKAYQMIRDGLGGSAPAGHDPSQ